VGTDEFEIAGWKVGEQWFAAVDQSNASVWIGGALKISGLRFPSNRCGSVSLSGDDENIDGKASVI
jgi:hypothetical protein